MSGTDVVTEFQYDKVNRLKTAMESPVGSSTTCAVGKGAIRYSYDGEGRRVRKQVGTSVDAIYVYDAAGNLAAEYGESVTGPGGVSYLTADHLGSTRVVTGADGTVKERRDYHPFGTEVTRSAGAPGYGVDQAGRQKFTGKERDAETGAALDRARASLARGEGISHEEILRDLFFFHRSLRKRIR